MSLMLVQGLSLSFGNKELFSDDGFSVGPRDRMGLVGANGTGKSTLLKVLSGQVVPDEGVLQRQRHMRWGYLPQELESVGSGPLVESVLRAVPGRDLLEKRLRETELALSSSSSIEEQMEWSQQMVDLTEEWTHFDEHFGRHRAESILSGLGFSSSDFQRDLQGFSGGWRMRAALAGLLLQDPDLLLLDEPTNHLDLPTLTWFDDFLRKSSKAFILISHDRTFLDRQINRVLALEPEGIRVYPGKYSDYQTWRATEKQMLANQALKQAQKRAQTEEFIERFRSKATKARQVQSRIKMLEKEERIEVLEERKTVSFSFPEVARSGREVAGFREVTRSFAGKNIYQNLTATLLRGQRIAVVGLNGAGKSTLLNLLAKELEPDSGEVWWGHNVSLGYYAQHHADALNVRSTIFEEVSRATHNLSTAAIRGVLGSFLFSGDDVDKPIGVLSGGEKARVALAKLLVTPCNLLLMDEPTNHLDLDSSEALIEALKGYSGTLLFVSHNQSFLNQLATDIWDVKDKTVTSHPGNLEEFMERLRSQMSSLDIAPSVEKRSETLEESPKEKRRREAEARQKRSQVEGPIRREIQQLEGEISKLELIQKEREETLALPDAFKDIQKARSLSESYQKGKGELESLYARWEQAQARLDSVSIVVDRE